MSRDAGKGRSSEDPYNGKLLYEIKNISNTLFLNKSHSRCSSSLSRNSSISSDRANAQPKHLSNDRATKHKKSFWKWKPLKAIAHVGHQRFNCCFTLEVHTIERLPSKFNNLDICVHWERKDGKVVTDPVKVYEGFAEFEEKLTQTYSIYASRNGPHHSLKYDAKYCLLYAEVHGNPKLEMGEYHVDLTRILPHTLEELDGNSSGTWTTSYKLLGEANGAIMNVSFGYVMLRDGMTAPNNKTLLQLLDPKTTTRNFVQFNQGNKGDDSCHSSPPAAQNPYMASRSMDGIDFSTDFSDSINTVYQKLDEEVMGSPVDIKHEIVFPADDIEPVKYSNGSPSSPSKGRCVNESDNVELSFSKKGIDSEEKADLDGKLMKHSDCSISDQPEGHTVNEGEDGGFSFSLKGEDLEEKDQLKGSGANTIEEQYENSPEHLDVHDDVGNTFDGHDNSAKNEVMHEISTKESLLEDLESVLGDVVELEKEGMETPDNSSESSDPDTQNRDKLRKIMPSPELLTVHEVEEYSSSFSSDLEPDSPRERLLREFLKTEEGSSLLRSGSSRIGSERIGSSRIGFEIDEDSVEDSICYAPTTSGWGELSEDLDSLPVEQLKYPKIRTDQVEYPKIRADQVEYPKIRAKVVEDLETQELTEELGFEEKDSHWSSPNSIGKLGSPTDTLPEDPSLPLLGEGLGPIIQTKAGGYLRSMNPVIFDNATSGGSLIMQVSSPIVIPAEISSGVTDVLQQLGSMGLEKLSLQAKKLMPLEDVTGKTVQHMAWKAVPQLESSKRQIFLQTEQDDQITSDEVEEEYVTLEELAPLAMDKIEELLIEGLRIQSGMSDVEAPSNITALPIRKISALVVKCVSPTSLMGFGGVAGLQLLDLEDTNNDDHEDEGLLGLSLTLDEWMRLDAGEIGDDQPSERTSKLLAAYHANSTYSKVLRGEHGKGSGMGGLLGNYFTLALMVQLRDPLSAYKPVGTPMLALIQVERAFVPANPKIYSTVPGDRNCNDEVDDLKSNSREVKTQEFKISEVHLAGLKGEPGKQTVWGNAAQQEAGSSWLLANGMGKSNDNNPFTRPKIVSKYPLAATMTPQTGDILWSISGQDCGSGAICKELNALNPYIRNPNVILSSESMKLY